jgi:hypothetical protein
MRIKTLSFLVLISFAFQTFTGQSQAQSLALCLRLFNENPTAAFQQESLQEPQKIGDSNEPRYTPTGRTVELPVIKPSDQCRTSECYLFSFVNYLNLKAAQRSDIASAFRVSHPLLVAHKFLQHIREGVWYGELDDRIIHDLKGGFSHEALHLSRLVGLAPEESWQPKVPFENWDTKKIYDVLETKVPEWNAYLRGLANKHGSWDAAPVRAAEKDAYEQLKHVILDQTGELPQSFAFKGKTMTPKDFELEFGAPRRVKLLIDLDGGTLPNRTKEILDYAMVEKGQGSWAYGSKKIDTILQEAVNWIKASEPVIIDFDWKTGGHSLLIVGYEVDGQNRVKRFKVMNSWGEDFGNDGYAWYTYQDIVQNIRMTYKFQKLKN